MAKALDNIAQKGYLPIFIPMQKKFDMEISLRIASKMKEKSKILDCEMSVCDMLSVIGQCNIVCGMRLHMLIFASVMNVPMAGIAYDPKIKGFMEYMHQKNYITLENFDAESFSKISGKVLENEALLKEELALALAPIREKAKENAFYAMELLKS